MPDLLDDARLSATSAVPNSGPDEPPEVWSPIRKISFRLLFCYIVLLGTFCLNLAFVINVLGFTGKPTATPLDKFWGLVVSFVARTLFRMRDFRFQALTSGDSLSDYLQVFSYLLIALLVTLVWSFIGRKTPNYSRLSEWLRLYAQIVLAVTLFVYGFDKVFPLQFGDLTPGSLVQSVGDQSHFSMLWLFMAASKPYTIFSGALELLAGVMLVVPKLRSAGALLAIAVLTNVFALNVFYDVPVKLFSLELLLLAIYLSAPEFPRLFRLLVLRQTVESPRETPLSANPRIARWASLAQTSLAIAVFAVSLASAARLYGTHKAGTRNVPLFGVWQVDQFQAAEGSQPLLTAKIASELSVQPRDEQWTQLVVDGSEDAFVQLHNGAWDYVSISINKDRTQLEMSDPADPKWKAHLAIQQTRGNLLRLQGSVNGVPVEISLHANEKGFRLTTGKYHIIRTY